ncbi:hypothetical protein [Micromonospora inyonensis]|uniref:hypothetical protein n=1 Tax=Micromonospora inyonensis TaxID=47866 RepID=UPI00114C8DC9|nr:hypothetical protein [Micromonospora inyonensis]
MCADIVPLLQNGVWDFYQANDAKPVTFNGPCFRGHVPELHDEAAGGKLAASRRPTGRRTWTDTRSLEMG